MQIAWYHQPWIVHSAEYVHCQSATVDILWKGGGWGYSARLELQVINIMYITIN